MGMVVCPSCSCIVVVIVQDGGTAGCSGVKQCGVEHRGEA
jgi:hypothetical protein